MTKTIKLYETTDAGINAWTGFYERESTRLVGAVVYDDSAEDRTVLRNVVTGALVAVRYEESSGDWLDADGYVTNYTLRAG